MKRLIKITGKVLAGLLLLIILVVTGIYWYVSTEWKKYYTEDEIKSFVNEIDASPTLTNTFYSIHDKLNNNDRHKSVNAVIVSAIWNELILRNHKSNTSWSEKAASAFPKKDGMRDYADFKLSWALEKYTTTEKCFDFAMGERYVRMNEQDTTMKPITLLNDTNEILYFLIKSRAPSLYKKHPEMLIRKIIELKGELN